MVVFGVVVLVLLLAAVQVWRLGDDWRADKIWRQLASTASVDPPPFKPAMLEGLPEPAIRYFTYTIRPGTPLNQVAEIDMHGEFGLGNQQAPNYLPMRATQILAPPMGFVWRMKAGKGLMRISGSDAGAGGESWTRFWVLGILPVARAGFDGDHARSAYGRLIAEAAIWTPAALLPGPGVSWQGLDQNRAVVTVRHGDLTQAVEITVAEDGQPTQVLLRRWSDANPGKIYQEQPFGGSLSEFQDFGGYRLPGRVEAGNFFGTKDFFAFFKVEVDAIRFIGGK